LAYTRSSSSRIPATRCRDEGVDLYPRHSTIDSRPSDPINRSEWSEWSDRCLGSKRSDRGHREHGDDRIILNYLFYLLHLLHLLYLNDYHAPAWLHYHHDYPNDNPDSLRTSTTKEFHVEIRASTLGLSFGANHAASVGS